jgi:hypothetical protein
MFIISQYLLHKSNLCNSDNISTYSIAVGLLIYSSIYLYLLYYNNEFLFIFNKFIIFIIGIDLLLSTFYHFNNNQTQLYNKQDTKIQDTKIQDTKIQDTKIQDIYLDESNNKIQEHLIISDDELTEDFDENLDEEVELDNDSENFNLEQDEQLQLEQDEQLQLEEIPDSNLQETIVEIQSQEIQHNNDIEKLLQSIPINDNVTSEIIIEQPKPKAKRQTKKRSNKVEL